ncbi:hypothetical protein VNO77_19427 [Canavalia gladiata]|uniref:Uncharacterized protein n=1 Tax=Canavalia gladiata TaxID=3824 RepID=A0AAN9QIH4_CANGL
MTLTHLNYIHSFSQTHELIRLAPDTHVHQITSHTETTSDNGLNGIERTPIGSNQNIDSKTVGTSPSHNRFAENRRKERNLERYHNPRGMEKMKMTAETATIPKIHGEKPPKTSNRDPEEKLDFLRLNQDFPDGE